MSAADQPTLTSPAEPYVGLRPFERKESDLLIGRGRDAQFLCDKVFSSPLTLLYAQSGLGKTSLLRALVIPKLADEGAFVVYYDAWSGDDPLGGLKNHLAAQAASVGIPNPLAGAPTLTELCCLLANAADTALVLVLDQFEEFLVNHGRRLDPLRKELAALARVTDFESHILISLREEFLASLEPFRQSIITLFGSTYRLEALSREEVGNAIVLPARRFGVEYDPELVEKIIQEVEEKERQTGLDGNGGIPPGKSSAAMRTEPAPQPKAWNEAISLPLLQLVCSQIWRAGGKDRKTLDLAFHASLGGVGKILNDYVDTVMPKAFSGQALAADLLRFLAPPSGLKQSFTVEDLANHTGLKPADVREELERLSLTLILQRRVFKHEIRYELQHDALISVLKPWRDKTLKRVVLKHKRSKIKSIGAVVLLAVAVLGFLWHWERERQLDANTEGPLAKLEEPLENLASPREASDSGNPGPVRLRSLAESESRPAATAFEGAASNLLWGRYIPGRLKRLRKLMIKYQKKLPANYGITPVTGSCAPDANENLPLELSYSTERELDSDYFTQYWYSIAKSLTETCGIPFPLRVGLKKVSTFPVEQLQVEGQGFEAFPLQCRRLEKGTFITELGLTGVGADFLTRFKSDTDWTLLEEIENGGPWYSVPRWSLPVWKVTAVEVNKGSALPAFLVAIHLQSHPEAMLPPEVVELLLQHTSREFPVKVREAKASRGNRLGRDLVEFARLERDLRQLPVILDLLAEHPADSSAAAVNGVITEMKSAGSDMPPRLHGPWKPEVARNPAPAREGKSRQPGDFHKAYREAMQFLPKFDTRIKITVGPTLKSLWWSRETASEAFNETYERFPDAFFKRFGLDIAYPEFLYDATLEGFAFHASNIHASEVSTVIVADSAASLDSLESVLASTAGLYRRFALDPEAVDRMLESVTSPSVRSWLKRTYSLTDLKILLRAMINPSQGGESDRLDGQETGSEVPAYRTLRHADWLLTSLVFWSVFKDPLDGPAMAAGLANTQRARLEFRQRPGPLHVDPALAAGIAELERGNIAEAQSAFRRLGKRAMSEFPPAYAQWLERKLDKEAARGCGGEIWVGLTPELRAVLQDRIENGPHGESGPALENALCLLAGSEHKSLRYRKDLIKRILAAQPDPEKWPAQKALDFSSTIMSAFGTVVLEKALLAEAAKFYASATSRREAYSYKDAMALRAICQVAGPMNWCWELLEKSAQASPDPSLPIEIAYTYSQMERKSDLEKAFAFAELGEKRIRASNLSPSAKARLMDSVRFIPAQTKTSLARMRLGSSCREADSLLLPFVGSKEIGGIAVHGVAQLYLTCDRPAEAESLIRSLLKTDRYSPEYQMEKFLLFLLQDKEDSASAFAETATRSDQDQNALFVAAVSQIVMGKGTWEETGRKFLATQHEYVNYIAMMLYGFMADQNARNLLEQRWKGFDVENWNARLQGGDPLVWREKLIGYYLGEVPRDSVFRTLEDEDVFTRSDYRFIPQSRTGMLCEAYFYDAMLSRANRDSLGMKKSLAKAVAVDNRAMIEFKIARFLLKRLENPADAPLEANAATPSPH